MMSSVRRRKPRPAPLHWSSSGASGSSECNTDSSDLCSVTTINSSSPGSTVSTAVCASVSSPRSRSRSPSISSRPNSPCMSPSPRGGNLAYLASRRSSRDSQGTSGGEISPTPTCTTNRQWKRRQSNFLELPVANHNKPRGCSLPDGYNPRTSAVDDLYRLRTFNITNKGVVNTGDSLIPRRSRSNISMNSSATSKQSNMSGERSPFDGSCCGSSAVSTDDEAEEEPKLAKFRVVLLGAAGVGKSALVHQFMTSEYINTYDVSLDDEFGERNVSVLLDSEESEIVFIDHPFSEMSVENCISTYDPHAAIVVYSVTDRTSFRSACEVLRYLWQEGFTKEKTVIVTGNKCDLARARTVKTQEGKSLACAYDCKFIETSSGIQHNVDELLVGTLKQCRLREDKMRKEMKNDARRKNKGSASGHHGSRTSLSLHMAKEILGKLCLQGHKSKSCENLLVL